MLTSTYPDRPGIFGGYAAIVAGRLSSLSTSIAGWHGDERAVGTPLNDAELIAMRRTRLFGATGTVLMAIALVGAYAGARFGGVVFDNLRNITFEKPAFGKRGYDEKSVNDFLALAARRLDGRGHLSADDVRGMRFNKPKLGKRGYDPAQVDQLVDEIATAIAHLDG